MIMARLANSAWVIVQLPSPLLTPAEKRTVCGVAPTRTLVARTLTTTDCASDPSVSIGATVILPGPAIPIVMSASVPVSETVEGAKRAPSATAATATVRLIVSVTVLVCVFPVASTALSVVVTSKVIERVPCLFAVGLSQTEPKSSGLRTYLPPVLDSSTPAAFVSLSPDSSGCTVIADTVSPDASRGDTATFTLISVSSLPAPEKVAFAPSETGAKKTDGTSVAEFCPATP